MTSWHVCTCNVLCTAVLQTKVCAAADKGWLQNVFTAQGRASERSCVVEGRKRLSVVPSGVKSVQLTLN